MELNETGTIDISKHHKLKVKCFKYYEESLKRNLIIHEDIDSKGCSSVSDEITGYKLFSMSYPISSLKEVQVQERMQKFIRHFTLEEIEKAFKRAEKEIEEKNTNKAKKK